LFALVNADGSIQAIRAVDKDDEAAANIIPALKAVTFPVIKIEGNPIPAVYLVRAVNTAGSVMLARSVGTEAMAIASDLAPAEFPLPVPAATPAPSTSAGTNTLKLGAGVSQPRIIQKAEPQYSQEARRAALAGKVRLKCIVGMDGKPRDFVILQSLGLGLDESAMLAAGSWVFQPGAKDGRPVNVYATLEINFHMMGSWHSSRVEFQLPPGASRPVIEKGGAPHVAANAASAHATLTFDIDEHGQAVNLHVDDGSDDGWARDVSNALRRWEFMPGWKDGSPISIPCTIDFVRGN
jgi:TonB family protein